MVVLNQMMVYTVDWVIASLMSLRMVLMDLPTRCSVARLAQV